MFQRKIILYFLIQIVYRFDRLDATYQSHQCDVCDQMECVDSKKINAHYCSETGQGGISGKDFVDGAFRSQNKSNDMSTRLKNFGTQILGLNETVVPTWKNLTRWGCYISKEKRRGCLIITKGFCDKDKSLFSQAMSLTTKLTNIIQNAASKVTDLFTDTSSSSQLDSQAKANITEWIAKEYFGVLLSNNPAEFSLDQCCEGNLCNVGLKLEQHLTMSLIAVGFVLLLF